MILTAPVRLQNIQALRGAAALLVLVFHIYEWHRLAQIDTMSSGTFPHILSNGFIGVDLFFVISGFIMVYVTRNKPRGVEAAKQFLRARVTRIYPLWWVYAGLMALYFWATYGVAGDRARFAEGQGVLSYLLKSFLLIPQEGVPVLGLGWSLIHEIYFYCVFAVLLLLPQKYLTLSLNVWACIILYGVVLGLAQPLATGGITLIFSPLTLEFLAGAFIGLLMCNGVKIYAKLLGLLGGALLLILFSPWGSSWDDVLPFGRVILFTLPLCLLVYSGAVLDLTRQYTAPKGLILIGNWSYSLYLSHIFVLSAVKRGLQKLGLGFQNPGPWDEIIFFSLSFSLSLILAAVSFQCIERPVIRYFRT